jgi:hypothetical protein
MKLIFLDIDGVLNSQLYYERIQGTEQERERYDLDPISIGFLNTLIEDTNAKVVIISTWRKYQTIEELQKLLETRGFIGEIIGFTPHLGKGNLRGNEILLWMNDNEKLLGESYSDFDTFVIFDDDSDMLYWQRENFILIDGYVGLTPTNCYKATRILNKHDKVLKNEN